MKNANNDVLAKLRKDVMSEINKHYKTVEQFCWENDLNKATLSNFLNDKKDFRVSTLAQIAKALGRELKISLN
ncbi:MAG: helix-turn-helix domain-containing protein [Bacteriovoracia bacterium]